MTKKVKGMFILIALIMAFSIFYFINRDALEETPVGGFNNMVNEEALKNSLWVYSAKQVAIKLVGEIEKGVERDIKIDEDEKQANVVIIDDKYRDDSIRGAKYKIKLSKSDRGVWNIQKAYYGFRCWKGRGHSNYSTVPGN